MDCRAAPAEACARAERGSDSDHVDAGNLMAGSVNKCADGNVVLARFAERRWTDLERPRAPRLRPLPLLAPSRAPQMSKADG